MVQAAVIDPTKKLWELNGKTPSDIEKLVGEFMGADLKPLSDYDKNLLLNSLRVQLAKRIDM